MSIIGTIRGIEMYIPVRLITKHYIPRYITKGMWFLSHLKGVPYIWEHSGIMIYDEGAFLRDSGYPVEIEIVNIRTDEPVVPYKEIKWIDDGEKVREISIDDINVILANGGECELDVRRHFFKQGSIVPVYTKEGVTLRLPMEEDDEAISIY